MLTSFKFILVALFCCMACISQAQKSLVFSSIGGSSVPKIITPILSSAYGELGIDIEIKLYPAGRALRFSTSGKEDGEAYRTIDFNYEESNLIRVDVVIAEVEWWVYAKHLKFEIEGESSLKPYRVSSRRGILVADKMLRNVRKKQLVNTFFQTLAILDAGRVDLALVPKWTSLSILKNNPMNIYPLKPAIRIDRLYHFLHEKHRKLVPKITKVLKRMEQEGDINRIWKAVEKQNFK
ncbi:MAG: hypothetical protein V7785_00865 [Bermanella sp.]